MPSIQATSLHSAPMQPVGGSAGQSRQAGNSAGHHSTVRKEPREPRVWGGPRSRAAHGGSLGSGGAQGLGELTALKTTNLKPELCSKLLCVASSMAQQQPCQPSIRQLLRGVNLGIPNMPPLPAPPPNSLIPETTSGSKSPSEFRAHLINNLPWLMTKTKGLVCPPPRPSEPDPHTGPPIPP